MRQAERLMLATPLISVSIGDKVPRLPPHITLVPWFDLSAEDWPDFDRDIREELLVEEGIMAYAAGDALYGEANDVAVGELGGVMFGAHALACAIVRRYGGEIDPTYTGLNWHPHVSYTPGRTIRTGEKLDIATLGVFSKDDDQKVVRALYDWQSDLAPEAQHTQ